jgi:SAM-dependent methyltransferase
MLTVDFRRISIIPGTRVLDAGCGTGRHVCEAFRRQGITVAGVDLKWDDLLKTRNFLSLITEENGGKWAVAQANIAKLPFADGFFDVVICSEVLEHIDDDARAISELMRVLRPGGDIVITVPRYLPERICWAISDAYHNEPGGHVRIYRKKGLSKLLENADASCGYIEYRHGLHSPYWWLKCLVGHNNETFPLVKAYRKFLEWDIINRPPLIRTLERMLNPLIGKSMVFYLKKGWS